MCGILRSLGAFREAWLRVFAAPKHCPRPPGSPACRDTHAGLCSKVVYPLRGRCRKPLGSLSFCIKEKLKGCNSHLEAQIEGPYFDKANICVPIVRALPEWFGIEKAILHYASEINILPTFLAMEASHTISYWANH